MNRLRFYVNKGTKLCYNCTVTASKRNARIVLALTTPYFHSTFPPIRFIIAIFVIHSPLSRNFSKFFLQNSVMFFCANTQTKRHSSFSYQKIVLFIVNISCVIMALYLPCHLVLAFLSSVVIKVQCSIFTTPSRMKHNMHSNLLLRGVR